MSRKGHYNILATEDDLEAFLSNGVEAGLPQCNHHCLLLSRKPPPTSLMTSKQTPMRFFVNPSCCILFLSILSILSILFVNSLG